jgi:aminotransferase
MINVFEPALGAEELDAVRQVFESNWTGKGKVTDRFETEFARHLRTDRALVRSSNSCTEGLFLSMDLLEIGPGDEVILPTISFVGAANAILASGARPVFCDVDRASLNATAAAIESCITKRTKAMVILHYGGAPCDMDSICELMTHYGIALVEDSACSVASRFRGTACGCFGDIGLWSFDSMKTLVTGDGGMVRCKTPELAHRAEQLLYLGLGGRSGFSSTAKTRWWDFEVECCGRRGVLNDVASAIGIEQLKKLPRFLARRKQIHECYDQELSNVNWLTCPPRLPHTSTSSYYMYWIQTGANQRDGLATHLREAGVYTTYRYSPLHQKAIYGAEKSLPLAEQAAEETLCLPIHPSLSDDDLQHIVASIRRFGSLASYSSAAT